MSAKECEKTHEKKWPDITNRTVYGFRGPKRILTVAFNAILQNQKTPEKIADTFSGVALNKFEYLVERETGFEPATSTLARLHSTAELFPRKYAI